MSMKFQFAKAAALVAALVSTAALAPSSAFAQDRPVTIYGESAGARTELVSLARLNLAKASDQRRLNHRVAAAVERVCLRDIGRDGLQDRGYYACEDQALSEAAPQIAAAIARSGDLALGGGAAIVATTIRVSAR